MISCYSFQRVNNALMESPKQTSLNITAYEAIVGKVLPNNSVEVIDLTCEEVNNEVNSEKSHLM